MVVEIFIDNLIGQMKAVSHREVAEIADVEARYRAEAGSEKANEILHCLNEGYSKLSGRLARWLRESTIVYSGVTPQKYRFEFMISERRATNKIDSLLDAMHSFILEYAMSKFYSIVSQGELSNKHSLLAVESGNNVDQLLLTKLPPRV